MEKLSDLPNIGKELEKYLHQVGINTPDELKNIGSCKAFQLIYAIDSTSCMSKLCALEGAIQGIRWHNLDSDSKQRLKEYLNLLQLSSK
jgi:DNA transformation protein and related proteins